MKYIQAIVCFGLFGWLGLAVLSGAAVGGEAGSRSANFLFGIVDNFNEMFGTTATGYGLLVFGLLFGWSLLLRGTGYRDQA